MSMISRRTALLGGAAALTTVATVAPVAIKAGAVREALAGPVEADPAILAVQEWEHRRVAYLAWENRYEAARQAADALFGPTPYDEIHWADRTKEQDRRHRAVNRKKNHYMEAVLGGDIDDLGEAACDPLTDACHVVLQTRPATLEGLRQKVRALYHDEIGSSLEALPSAGDLWREGGYSGVAVLAYLHEDLEALAGRSA